MLLIFGIAGCAPAQNMAADQAQLLAQAAWQEAWQGTWELQWAESPIAGAIVFAGWQTEAAEQRRYEILEADLPSLIGLVYIDDGQSAQYYNRLDSTASATKLQSNQPFSPISDAFQVIAQQLNEPPQAATQRSIDLPDGRGIELQLQYPQGQTLTLWFNNDTDLISRASLESTNHTLSLTVRELTPLTNPHPGLFQLPQ